MHQEYLHTHAPHAWKEEEPAIRARLEALEEHLCARYHSPSVVGAGGAGIVLRIHDRELADQPCALKFARPATEWRTVLATMIERETAYLAELRHNSIVRLRGSGKLVDSETGEQFAYYMMDFVDGENSATFFAHQPVDERDFVGAVARTVGALVHLHASGIAHLDIKPDNILIDRDGQPVLADLGTAKRIQATDDRKTIVGATLAYADVELIQAFGDTDPVKPRLSGELPRSAIRLRWDLAPFGKTLLRWLQYDPRSGERSPSKVELSPYATRYLVLLAARLLGARNAAPWLYRETGLTPSILDELRYKSFDSVALDLRKLTAEFSIVEAVPELNIYTSDTVQVMENASTPFSRRTANLLEHPAVRRLAYMSQLGVVDQVYPTATHSRLQHSLGTFHNACRIILSLYHDPLSPLFRQMVDETDVCTVLTASILHDVGQFPLAHDLEEIDPGLFSHTRLTKSLLRGQDQAIAAATGRRGSAVSLSDGIVTEVATSFREVLEPWGTTPERVVTLLDAKLNNDSLPVKDRVLHSIIDGPLDADKLDYLVRDSRTLGIPYGRGIDVERIVRSMTVALDLRRAGRSVAAVGVHEKAKIAAEFVTIARSAMFSQSYWHHAVRAVKAMLSRSTWRLIEARKLNQPKNRKRFIRESEQFMLALPESLYSGEAFSGQGLVRTKQHASGQLALVEPASVGVWGSTMAPAEAAVVLYFLRLLEEAGCGEAELLADLLQRRFYKRLYVFSLEGRDGGNLPMRWERADPLRKLAVYEYLESAVSARVEARLTEGPTTVVLDEEVLGTLKARVASGLPTILIDLPGDRPGSDVPLYYILEGQRRALRRSVRAIGEVQTSRTWDEYAARLREKAGKFRIYCHPSFIDAVESALEREEFMGLLDAALSAEGA
ncbi:MAG: protein kinase domain-containing protein [Acidimicrobiia bacterium]